MVGECNASGQRRVSKGKRWVHKLDLSSYIDCASGALRTSYCANSHQSSNMCTDRSANLSTWADDQHGLVSILILVYSVLCIWLLKVIRRERVAHILQAEPIRNVAGFDQALADSEGKSNSYSNLPTLDQPLSPPLTYPPQCASSSSSSRQGRGELTLRHKLGVAHIGLSPTLKVVDGHSLDSGLKATVGQHDERMRRGSDMWGLHEILEKGPV